MLIGRSLCAEKEEIYINNQKNMVLYSVGDKIKDLYTFLWYKDSAEFFMELLKDHRWDSIYIAKPNKEQTFLCGKFAGFYDEFTECLDIEINS